jgi:hypothetical protein
MNKNAKIEKINNDFLEIFPNDTNLKVKILHGQLFCKSK